MSDKTTVKRPIDDSYKRAQMTCKCGRRAVYQTGECEICRAHAHATAIEQVRTSTDWRGCSLRIRLECKR